MSRMRQLTRIASAAAAHTHAALHLHRAAASSASAMAVAASAVQRRPLHRTLHVSRCLATTQPTPAEDVAAEQRLPQPAPGQLAKQAAAAAAASSSAVSEDPVQRAIKAHPVVKPLSVEEATAAAAMAASSTAPTTGAADVSRTTTPTGSGGPCPPPADSIFSSSLCEFRASFDAFERGEALTAHVVARSRATSQNEVFANADLPLARIEAYGFDFDYTLASYNANVDAAIYLYAARYLVEQMGYPPELLSKSFDPAFAIRGLHFDTKHGFILKIDQHGKVQTSCVYRGRQRVGIVEIVDAYQGVSLTSDYRSAHIQQLADLFAISETNLLGDVVQLFLDKSLAYSPDYIARDVRRAVEHVHVSGELHGGIMASPETYLDPSPSLGEYLLRLRAAGKINFLLTNSPYAFVDRGMTSMLRGIESSPLARGFGIKSSSQWRELFDVCITSARKPQFFTRRGHFRRIDLGDGNSGTGAGSGAAGEKEKGVRGSSRLSWQPVSAFVRGEVYTEGSLVEFTRLLGALRTKGNPIRGHNVLYMGDHVTADLTAPWQAAKWRTVAIVREIAHETATQSSPAFRSALERLLRIEALIDYGQRLVEDEETRRRLAKLKRERQGLKQELLQMFNPHFGSVFRTSSNRTEFFGDVGRFADIYTSSVTNFQHYSLEHCFYAQRRFFPHETPFHLAPNAV